MKIHRAMSEKRTIRTVTDEFISREFSASREITVSDDTPPALLTYLQIKLEVELRRGVLTSLVLEGLVTSQEMAATLAPFQGMLQAAQDQAKAEIRTAGGGTSIVYPPEVLTNSAAGSGGSTP